MSNAAAAACVPETARVGSTGAAGDATSRAKAPQGAQRLLVGGLAPLTSTDYPGELAAVVFCQGCPWRCRYCHNGHLLAAEAGERWPWAEVVAFLAERRGLLDAVCFSGGEPTAQRALPEAIAEVRRLGFKVGLHTAGPYPERLPALIGLVDWFGLDIKALPEDYPAITGVPGSGERAWRSLRLLLDAGVELEVRTTPMPGRDDDASLGRLMRGLADAGVRRYAIQHCDDVRRLDPTLTVAGRAAAPLLPERDGFQRCDLRGWASGG